MKMLELMKVDIERRQQQASAARYDYEMIHV
jgi:hypothetical protein